MSKPHRPVDLAVTRLRTTIIDHGTGESLVRGGGGAALARDMGHVAGVLAYMAVHDVDATTWDAKDGLTSQELATFQALAAKLTGVETEFQALDAAIRRRENPAPAQRRITCDNTPARR